VIPLIVDLETEWRGGQNQALLLLRGLYERGHAAELVATHGSSLSHRAKKAGIHVHSVSRGLPRLAAAAKIRSLLAEGRIELVHANEAHAITAAWLALKITHLPFVVSRRVGYPLRKNWIAQARYRSANRIVANSRWVADQAAASGASRDKIRVVYEGVEIPALPSADAKEAARKRWSIGKSDRVLGCVGALQWDKGHEWAIRALALLRPEFPQCKLLLAGEGEYRPQLEALAAQLKVREQVIFAGFLKDISVVYEAIDIFVFPSLFEGLGTSLLSAMGYGLPSITFFGCALGEIVENGRSGLQVEARNSAEVAKAVAGLLRDPDFAQTVARAGRARVMEIFSADRMVEGTLKVYEEVLGSG
jgi:glycosyltransferase involved in cell wall biosynthesis